MPSQEKVAGITQSDGSRGCSHDVGDMLVQGAAMGDLNKRRGVIMANDAEGDDALLGAYVPLSEMFGYSTSLRSMTQV